MIQQGHFCVLIQKNIPKSLLTDKWIRKMWNVYTMEYFLLFSP